MGAWSLGQERSKTRLANGSQPPRRPTALNRILSVWFLTHFGTNSGRHPFALKRPNNGSRSCRAVIVEDEPFLRYSMAYALRGDGRLILEASSGEGAVAYLKAGEKIDIVFTDITLGGLLSGWDVADAFRLARSEIPIIYTSGNADDRSRRAAPMPKARQPLPQPRALASKRSACRIGSV
jgi:CheY-like chemotaxis protein